MIEVFFFSIFPPHLYNDIKLFNNMIQLIEESIVVLLLLLTEPITIKNKTTTLSVKSVKTIFFNNMHNIFTELIDLTMLYKEDEISQ